MCGFDFSTSDFGKHDTVCRSCLQRAKAMGIKSESVSLFDRKLMVQLVVSTSDAEFDRRMAQIRALFLEVTQAEEAAGARRLEQREQEHAQTIRHAEELAAKRRNEPLYKKNGVGNLSVDSLPSIQSTAMSQALKSEPPPFVFDVPVNADEPPELQVGCSEMVSELLYGKALGWFQAQPDFVQFVVAVRAYNKWRNAHPWVNATDQIQTPTVPPSLVPVLRAMAEERVAAQSAWESKRPVDVDSADRWDSFHKDRVFNESEGRIRTPTLGHMLVASMPLQPWEIPANKDSAKVLALAEREYKRALSLEQDENQTAIDDEHIRLLVEKQLEQQTEEEQKMKTAKLFNFNLRT